MKTRLDKSHELAYLKKYHGKKFKVKEEIELKGMKPNIYTLGSLTTIDQMVTVDWWLIFDGQRKTQHAVEYRLGKVLELLITGNWIIQK